MLAWGPFAHPTSSFNKPVPLPGAEPDQGPCATVSFSRAWLPYVLGAMTQLMLQTTWLTDDPDEFRLVQEQASTLIAMFAEQGYDMLNGCNCPDVLTRLNAYGVLEQSTDGGITWNPEPYSDPRLTGTLFPPLPLATGTVTRCAAAENIVATFTGLIDQSADNLEQAASVAEMIADIVAAAAAYLGYLGPIALMVTLTVNKIFSFTGSALRAAFDNDVFDRLKCNLYCNCNDDGTFSSISIQAIHDQIDTDETGLAKMHLHDLITIFGEVGLTNMGRAGASTGTGCDDCTCDCEEPTSTATYVANAANAAYTIGQYVLDGACDGRKMSGGAATNNVRLIIPDRAGRKVMRVQIGYCDSSGSPLDVDVEVNSTASEEGTQEAHGAPVYTFDPPIADDQIDVSMPTPSQGWLLLHHITVYYCGEE